MSAFGEETAIACSRLTGVPLIIPAFKAALHRNGDSFLGVITNTRIGDRKMIRAILVAAVALASVSVGPRHTEAYEAPWCAVISTGEESVYWDCQYRSLEECRPNVLAGNRGWCNPSPYYVASIRRAQAAPGNVALARNSSPHRTCR